VTNTVSLAITPPLISVFNDSEKSLAGEIQGGCGRSDQAMLVALRYHTQSEWHKACGVLLNQLPIRQAAAMLM